MIIQSENFIQNPLVSVVVITYNQEQYIRQCIESILSQESEYSYEIIIGEDCGTDSTRNICIEYQQKNPEKISLLLQEHNQGLIKNYRDVLSLCRGKYIAQCAGDDYWCDKYKLQLQYDCLENKSGFGFVRTGGYLLENKKMVDVPSTAHDNSEGDVFHIAKYGSVSIAASIFFKRELLQHIDFNEFINRNFSAEDYPLNAILARHTYFAYIPKKCVVYRRIKSSISHTKQEERYLNYISGFVEIKRYLNFLYPNECNFNNDELSDMVDYANIKVKYKKFNYRQAKKTANNLRTNTYKDKILSKMTSNILYFYIVCILYKIKNLILYKI